MIDMNNERCHTLGKLARMIPQKRAPRTIKNWCLQGVKTASGDIVKMESVLYGGERISSMEAFERFIARINDDDGEGATKDNGPEEPKPARGQHSEAVLN